MKKLIVLICVSLLSLNLQSSHILGGDLSCSQTGANTFKYKLRMLSDSVVSTSSTVALTIRVNAIDTIHGSVILTYDSTKWHITIKNSIHYDSSYIHYYSANITLPNNPNGFYATHSHCDRIISENMDTSCYLFYCKTPDPAIPGGNSNPDFVVYTDSLYFSIFDYRTLNFSCTDMDGDSLVYSLSTPLNMEDTGGGKPFIYNAWKFGYNLLNVIGPGSHHIVNKNTGFTRSRPYRLGIYIIAIKCEEFRNGIKIGEVIRDIPITARNYPITTGINENSNINSSISIFPNPNNGIFNLNIKDIETDKLSVKIYSLSGQLVLAKESLNANNKINLNSVEKGVYFVHIESKNESVVKKIIIN